eukprot:scaffold25_cov342-Pavlova_lutheri.AAC.55
MGVLKGNAHPEEKKEVGHERTGPIQDSPTSYVGRASKRVDPWVKEPSAPWLLVDPPPSAAGARSKHHQACAFGPPSRRISSGARACLVPGSSCPWRVPPASARTRIPAVGTARGYHARTLPVRCAFVRCTWRWHRPPAPVLVPARTPRAGWKHQHCFRRRCGQDLVGASDAEHVVASGQPGSFVLDLFPTEVALEHGTSHRLFPLLGTSLSLPSTLSSPLVVPFVDSISQRLLPGTASSVRAALVLRSSAPQPSPRLTPCEMQKGGIRCGTFRATRGALVSRTAARGTPSFRRRVCFPFERDPSRSPSPFEEDGDGRRKECGIGRVHPDGKRKHRGTNLRAGANERKDEARMAEGGNNPCRGKSCRGRNRPTRGGGPARTPPCGGDGSRKTSFLTLRHSTTIEFEPCKPLFTCLNGRESAGGRGEAILHSYESTARWGKTVAWKTCAWSRDRVARKELTEDATTGTARISAIPTVAWTQ